MNRLAALVLPFLLVACVADEEAVSDVESYGTSYQGTSYQGTSYQGTSYQGTSYQGTSYQGTSYQGTSYQGASYGSATLNGKVTKTTIETWRQLPSGNWEQRLPDKICLYNATKTSVSCQSVNLNTSPSPLAGVKFQATFVDPDDGTTRQGTLRIGSGTSDVGAVRKDTWMAMHPLEGAATGPKKYSADGCAHPNGCRINSDLWLYDVELVDTNGTAINFCKGNEQAFALADTWDLTGQRQGLIANKLNGQFTFACTNGTIAKCTRWGYRPFGKAKKTNGTLVDMAPYHQACIRAAAADYCANGTSFTKDGTLIDIYDYQPHQTYSAGFIPRTVSLEYVNGNQDPPSAFTWEAMFDRHGGAELDFVRYAELGNLQNACPGRFSLGTAPMPDGPHILASRGPESFEPPYVTVDSTTTCSHDESTLGRWLHPECSACTKRLWVEFGDFSCINSSGTWNEYCQKLALDRCPAAERMAAHSECMTGPALHIYDTACTLNICGNPQYASCCTSGWTSACTAAANARCTGGREHFSFDGQYGFCNVAIPLVLE